MSCNGCRVLRKGCAPNCTLKPCLQWIQSPQSQANATLFLAKFYGRAGLINLINSGPPHLHSEIFRSLLYEACGRIINPVHGSVGLISSGHWPRCQAAVEAVLLGTPLMTQVSDDEDSSAMTMKGCDIRHLSKDSSAAVRRRRVRTRSNRSSKSRVDSFVEELMNESEKKFTITGWESYDSCSVETVEPELGLELTLGFCNNRVVEISDSEN